jgi:hypothetical protein
LPTGAAELRGGIVAVLATLLHGNITLKQYCLRETLLERNITLRQCFWKATRNENHSHLTLSWHDFCFAQPGMRLAKAISVPAFPISPFPRFFRFPVFSSLGSVTIYFTQTHNLML